LPDSRRSGLSSARPAGGDAIRAWLVGLRAWSVAHPDLAAVLPVLAIGVLFRAALLYRIPPLFMPGDSQSFLLPAYDLTHGLPFDPILKRPLGYPLLMAADMATFGEDLRALVWVQAALGLVTILATYWIGRLTFHRTAGVIAALMVAVGGQLLIYEHYILAESVFGMLLALAVLALILGARGGTSAWAALLGGLGLAAASLFRPIAEVMLFVAPAYFLILVRPARRALLLSLILLAGFLALMVPAFVLDLALRGGTSSGALGEHLLWRITRSDSGYITRDDVTRLDRAPADTPSLAARRYVVRRAADRTLPQEIFTGLRREQGLGPGEADAIMRSVALEAIARQPGRYLTSTLRMSVELFVGEEQRLGEISKRDGDARYANPQSKQRTWFEDRILHLGAPADPAVQNEFDRAEAITTLYQPDRFRWLVIPASLAGALFAIMGRPNRLALLLVLAIPPMLLANAALAGPEVRFRYPMDPLIGVLAAGGLVGLCRLVWAMRRRPAAVTTE
jgi:Dolichyl-phosphate-mannose-protein mannosyltransferase